MSALHVAAQSGRLDMVKYLLDKGANPELVNFDGKKPIDLAGTGAAPGRGGPAPAAPTAGGAAVAAFTPPAGARGGGGRGGAPPPANTAEIRTLLQTPRAGN
jgi:hypothetical protein